MDHSAQRAASWDELTRALGGSFAARARGVVSPELVLLTGTGYPFGRLAAGEADRTHLQAGELTAWIEPLTGGAHAMTTGDEETLIAETAGPASALTLRSGGRTYEASISLFRNSATARASDGGEAARVSGGLTNRRYRAVFDPQDPASLPIAVFLLHRTFALRSMAYRASP
ncbi:MAG TPA: hypothetical protein VKA73_05085 [Rubrobacter sp.]|nr:hypothetical protein [Rubrobacter sp.]